MSITYDKLERQLRRPLSLMRTLLALFIISWIITIGVFSSINENLASIIEKTDGIDATIMSRDSIALAKTSQMTQVIHQVEATSRTDLIKNYMPAFKGFYFRLFYLFFISLFFSFIGLLLILQWKNSTQELSHLAAEDGTTFHIDYGLLYLAVAMLLWTINTNWGLIDIRLFGAISDNKYLSVIESILSSTNSLFFLFLIRTFKFNKEPGWKKWPILIILKKKRWTFYLYLCIVVFTLILHFTFWSTAQARYSNLPDFFLSLLTISSLFIYLYFSFEERNLSNLKWVIGLCIFLTFWAHTFTFSELPFPELTPNLRSCVLITYTVSLIILLLVLASSWKSFEIRKILNHRMDRIKENSMKINGLRREMNHAVRSSLNNLYFDFKDMIEDYEEDTNFPFHPEIRSIKDRIKSIHLLHDIMHESQSSNGYINLNDYFPRLVEHLKNSHNYADHETEFKIEIDQSFKPSIARELGIAIVELSLNAYNAFQKKQIGEKFLGIYIRKVQTEQAEQMEITVSDKGPGFKPEKNKSNGFGLNYVNKIVDSLGGKFILPKIGIKTPLTTFKILIPVKNKSI